MKNTEKNTNNTLARNHKYVVRDYSNTEAVLKNGRTTAGAEVEGERVLVKYAELYKDFKAGIQIDLNNQAYNWRIKEGAKDGAVLFHNPPVYSYVEAYDVYESVSSAQDATIPYAFFMLRYIQGDLAKNLGPNFTITVDKQKTSAYDKLDVYEMFEYYKGGHLKLIEKNGKVSESVIKLFKDNAEQFKYNIQNIYHHNADLCNYLHTVEEQLQLYTCFGSAGRGPEQILSILLCLEMFHSFSDSSLCPELIQTSPDDT